MTINLFIYDNICLYNNYYNHIAYSSLNVKALNTLKPR